MNVCLGRDQCLQLDQLTRHEWLETNGLGGYAASTTAQCHTRKYHGLLVLQLQEPPGKFVLLSKLEAGLGIADDWYELAVNQYRDGHHPHGWQYLAQVSHELWLTETFEVAGCVLLRDTLMPRGEQAIMQRYTLLSAPGPVTLRLTPLLAYRDHHALTHANPYINPNAEVQDGRVTLRPYFGLPSLVLESSRPWQFEPAPCWYYNLTYAAEYERGFDHREDLFQPGILTVKLAPGDILVLRAGTAPATEPLVTLWDSEARRREGEEARYMSSPLPLRLLQTQAEQYLITRPDGAASVVAGYPWFGDWGRDTMIALPGLAVACGRLEVARQTLESWAAFEKDGRLPNYLGHGPHPPSYNSMDASLWFLRALQDYLVVSKQWRAAAETLLPVAERIVNAFAEGRVAEAELTPDGLISAGNPNTQLTWMDARVHGRPVTPRHGLAIELNALWYNGLVFLAKWYRQLRRPVPPQLSELRQRVAVALPARFWVPEGAYLADCVTPEGQDRSIRPNQIFAVALPASALTLAQQRAVVACVREHLFTPYGLRTLAPGHPDYRGTYGGNPVERDGAYHQGTVWPWLIGAYVDAELRVASDPAARARELRQILAPLCETHPTEYGIHGVSEVFSGDAPFHPGGCPHQAWSAAEVIRASCRLQQLAPT